SLDVPMPTSPPRRHPPSGAQISVSVRALATVESTLSPDNIMSVSREPAPRLALIYDAVSAVTPHSTTVDDSMRFIQPYTSRSQELKTSINIPIVDMFIYTLSLGSRFNATAVNITIIAPTMIAHEPIVSPNVCHKP